MGEQHAEFDLAGPGPTVGVLPGSPGGVGGHGRGAGAVDRDIQLRDRGGWPDRDELSGQHRGRVGITDREQRLPVGLGAAFHSFGRQRDAGQVGQQLTRFGERHDGADPCHHRPQPGAQGGTGHPEFVIAWYQPGPAVGAVVVGPPQRDRPEHSVQVRFLSR